MATFFEVNNVLAGFVFYSSLKASLLITLVWLAKRMFSRYLSAQGHYLSWLAVVICLITPVGFTALIPQLPILPSPLAKPVNVIAANSEEDFPQILPTLNEHTRTMPTQESVHVAQTDKLTSLSVAVALQLLWLSGVLMFIGTVLIRHQRFSRVVRAAAPASATLQELLDDCRRQAGCNQHVRLLCCADIDAPLITGCFQSRLLLPAGLAQQLSKAQLRHVFLHELMHVKNYDIIANWLLTLLQAFHWFNPLVWFSFKQLRFDRELARDAATVNHLQSDDGQDYGHTLLQLSQPLKRRHVQTIGALGIVDDHAQLRRRIVMIVQGSLSTRFQSLLTAALLLLFGTVAFSMPAFDKIDSAMPVPAVSPVTTLAARATEASATNEVIPAINSVIDARAAAATAPTMVSSNRAMAATKAAKPSPVAAATSTASDRSEFVAPVTEPALMLALADNATPSVARPAIEMATSKPETYAHWNAIQTLAKAAAAARDAGVKSITQWNKQADACGASAKEFAQLNLNLTKAGCREIIAAIQDPSQIDRFLTQCVAFMKSYNELATNFAGAPDSQFVDRPAVKSEMLQSYQTLNEFCGKQIYHQTYSQMVALIRDYQNNRLSMQTGTYAIHETTEVRSYDNSALTALPSN